MLSFAHFREEGLSALSTTAKTLLWVKDIGSIVFSPIAAVGLQLAAIYGLFSPKNGRKLYATFERCIYGRALLAPCFQPNPADNFQHALGGEGGGDW